MGGLPYRLLLVVNMHMRGQLFPLQAPPEPNLEPRAAADRSSVYLRGRVSD